jgi:hypothetical protein
MRSLGLICLAFTTSLCCGCSGDDDSAPGPGKTGGLDPATAPHVEVDRFSSSAGMLMVRDGTNGLPGPNEPIDFDSGAPFVTQGFGPAGEVVKYYNFDVQPTAPAPIYALFRAGEDKPVSGQLNVVDVVPGDEGYNDFWQVMKVTVPSDYVANTVTSAAEIRAQGFSVESTDMLVNCPIVPEGSSAKLRVDSEPTGLSHGWYRDRVVSYLTFSEAALSAGAQGEVPLAPIYVTFNVNPAPDEPMSGPASGFRVESGSMQTHNVPATLPTDPGYSPLWAVHIYDDADFASVMDLATASKAKILEPNGPTVNCPIVAVD